MQPTKNLITTPTKFHNLLSHKSIKANPKNPQSISAECETQKQSQTKTQQTQNQVQPIQHAQTQPYPQLEITPMQDTQFFHNQILPLHSQSPHSSKPYPKLIQQFLPFDPTIVEIFDEQDFCDGPLRRYFIVGVQSVRNGLEIFNQENENGVCKQGKDIIDKYSNNKDYIVYLQRYQHYKDNLFLAHTQRLKLQNLKFSSKAIKNTSLCQYLSLKQPLIVGRVLITSIIYCFYASTQFQEDLDGQEKGKSVLYVCGRPVEGSIQGSKDNSMCAPLYTIHTQPRNYNQQDKETKPHPPSIQINCYNLDSLLTQAYCFDLQLKYITNKLYNKIGKKLQQFLFTEQQEKCLDEDWVYDRLRVSVGLQCIWNGNSTPIDYYQMGFNQCSDFKDNYKFKATPITSPQNNLQMSVKFVKKNLFITQQYQMEQKQRQNKKEQIQCLINLLQMVEYLFELGLAIAISQIDCCLMYINIKLLDAKDSNTLNVQTSSWIQQTYLILPNMSTAFALPTTKENAEKAKSNNIIMIIQALLSNGYQGQYLQQLRDIVDTVQEDLVLGKFGKLLDLLTTDNSAYSNK